MGEALVFAAILAVVWLLVIDTKPKGRWVDAADFWLRPNCYAQDAVPSDDRFGRKCPNCGTATPAMKRDMAWRCRCGTHMLDFGDDCAATDTSRPRIGYWPALGSGHGVCDYDWVPPSNIAAAETFRGRDINEVMAALKGGGDG